MVEAKDDLVLCQQGYGLFDRHNTAYFENLADEYAVAHYNPSAYDTFAYTSVYDSNAYYNISAYDASAHYTTSAYDAAAHYNTSAYDTTAYYSTSAYGNAA
mmetsp:Transcript_19487/g.31117  ORF Transcript_19487/g.31117 Transcript_19487/m.31117 type:complete len:101 (-) Transcript_19487:522-824(-)